MKIYISNYTNHWNVYKFFRQFEKFLGEKRTKSLTDYFEDGWLSSFFNFYNNRISKRIEYVKIDYWDVWSLDSTLSKIILPSLYKLKDTKHGAPTVDDADVPSFYHNNDKLFWAKWDYVLDEMIFAFEYIQYTEDHISHDPNADRRQNNGFKLFGKYYRALWD